MDALALDWRISMKHARAIVGSDRVLCGNVDPITLYGTDEQIKQAVQQNIADAGAVPVSTLFTRRAIVINAALLLLSLL